MRLRSHAACRARVSTFQLQVNPIEFSQVTLVEIPGSVVPLHTIGEGVPTRHLKSLFFFFEHLHFFFFFFFNLWFWWYESVGLKMNI